MPDKQNENKLMSMLERRGIVRKADSEDELSEKGVDEKKPRSDIDMRTVLGAPVSDAPVITPASRQPVPGISNPVLPSERPQNQDRGSQRQEKPQSIESRVVDLSKVGSSKVEPVVSDTQPQFAAPKQSTPQQPTPQQPTPQQSTAQRADVPKQAEQVQTVAATASEQQKPPFSPQVEASSIPKAQQQTEPQRFEEPAATAARVTPAAPVAEPPMPITQQAPASATSGQHSSAEGVSLDDSFYNSINAEVIEYAPVPPPIEYHTNRYMGIEELYDALALKVKRTDTIYLIEEYLNSLPDSLPDESRRDIVSKIVSASGFDYDLLMGDGVLRVKMLKEYAERFSRHTDEYVAERQAELDELDRQIQSIRGLIENRMELHKKQFFTIEAEAQRLKDILTFISG